MVTFQYIISVNREAVVPICLNSYFRSYLQKDRVNFIKLKLTRKIENNRTIRNAKLFNNKDQQNGGNVLQLRAKHLLIIVEGRN